MSISGRALWQLQLFSLICLIVPMIVYPAMLGTDLQKFSLTYIACEVMFYVIVTYVLYRQVTFFQAIQISGLCLIYRLLLGSVFSFLLAVVHSISINISFTLGMFGYLPSLLLHIVATPLILKPTLDGAYSESSEGRFSRTVEKSSSVTSDSEFSPMGYSKERKSPKTVSRAISNPVFAKKPLEYKSGKETQYTSVDLNGFDKATKYLGEDGSVRLAAVLDNEGLLLSNFTRGGLVAEDIAPFALTIAAACADKIGRLEFDAPERIEFMLKNERIVLATEEHWTFMIIAERRGDDMLDIRIMQAIEMIKKYTSERYSQKLHPIMEKSYA